MKPAPRTLVLINPNAGVGKAHDTWRRDLASQRNEHDPAWRDPVWHDPIEIVEPDPATSRHELAAALRQGTFDRLLAVGGDGTAHLAANVLLEEGLGEQVALGLIPAGTGSDLARGLGLPRRPGAALRAVMQAEPQPMDALCVETEEGERRYVVNIASAGLSGRILTALDTPGTGSKSYLATTLRELIRYRPIAYRLRVEGETFLEGPMFLIAAANGRFFGSGMQVAPRARIDDGQIEVVAISPIPKLHLPIRLPQFLTGRHMHLPAVHSRVARQLEIECLEAPPPYDLDGELCRTRTLRITVLPRGLRVLYPG